MTQRDIVTPIGPAPTPFPIPHLRDYYAALAMQSFLSASPCRDKPGLVKEAYEVADAMLAAGEVAPTAVDKGGLTQ